MAILATDSFTRADAATLGANWILMKGIPNHMGIFSNAVDISLADNRCADVYDGGIIWPDNQYAKAKVVALPAATGVWAVCVRAEAVSGVARNFYAAGVDPQDTSSFQTGIWKWVGSVWTGLGLSGTVDIAPGDTVSLEAVGTTLTCKVNGVQKVQVTDGSFTSGKPGLHSVHTTIDVALFDDFEAGDFDVKKGKHWTLLNKSRK